MKLKSEFLIVLSHRYCKLFKFPIWVGIVPDNWLEWRYLFLFLFFPSFLEWKLKKSQNLEIEMKITKFANLLNVQVELELSMRIDWNRET